MAALAVSLCCPCIATAQTSVTAQVTKLIDGDTFSVKAEIWPDITYSGKIRVLGVDTPELNGKCNQEKKLAIAARDFVENLLADRTVTLTEMQDGFYSGRVLARVQLASGQNLASLLIRRGYGRPWKKGERINWCDKRIAIPRSRPSAGDNPNAKPAPTRRLRSRPATGEELLERYDDNGNGRISCAEARAHGIAPVRRRDAIYPYVIDRDKNGVACE